MGLKCRSVYLPGPLLLVHYVPHCSSSEKNVVISHVTLVENLTEESGSGGNWIPACTDFPGWCLLSKYSSGAAGKFLEEKSV